MDIRMCVYAVVAYTLILLGAILVVERPRRKAEARKFSQDTMAQLLAKLDALDQQIAVTKCRVEALSLLTRRRAR